MTGRPLPRRIGALTAAALMLLTACGDDGAEPAPGESTTTVVTVPTDDTSTTSTPDATTSTPESPPSSTTTPAAPPVEGTLMSGSVTNARGIEAVWSLTAGAGQLCFAAELDHADPDVVATLSSGIDDCLRPPGGRFDDLDDALSVSVGVVDGERSFGYLWGRVDRTIISLTIEHTDGSQTVLDLVPGPDDTQVFSVIVDIDGLPPVDSLDAVSGTQIEDSEVIRDFLRAGPTYPVVPGSTVPNDELYPTTN